jgi:hypothetical protein
MTTEHEPLSDPEEWDFDAAEGRQPVRRARAIVSVAFAADDFDLVNGAARARGLRTSEFIRESALRAARGGVEYVSPTVGSSGASSYAGDVEPARTASSAEEVVVSETPAA